MLRLFKRGDIEEDWIADDLRNIGVSLTTEDPETGDQWRMSWFGGHFGGSCDGLGRGFPGARESLHVFECKTANSKWFKKISKEGVEKSMPKHFAQMQAYMHGFRDKGISVNRAFYVCVCKDTDEIYTERIHYDHVVANAIIHKAELVVGAPEPLTRISEDPSWHQCQFCEFRPICHFERAEHLERNCRTCTSSTPLPDGTWFCDHLQKLIDEDDQRQGCDKHLFIPSLLPWEAIDADEVKRAVFYRDRNGVMIVDSALQLTVQEEPDD